MENGMGTHLRLSWDKEGDIFHIDTVWPRKGPIVADFLADDVVALVSEETGALVGIEILGFSTHFNSPGAAFSLPLLGNLFLDPAHQTAGETTPA